MKRLLTLLSLITISSVLLSNPVSKERAKAVATSFFENQYFKSFGSEMLFSVESFFERGNDLNPAYYIFNNSNGGFVIVSGDDIAFPIIGYSFEGKIDIENLPAQLDSYLNSIENQILEIRGKSYKSTFSDLWEKFQNPVKDFPDEDFKSVPALLTTKWDQGTNYNSYCPPASTGPNGHCVTGCVATAMGQLMKYHNYPEHGTGTLIHEFGAIYTLDLENTYYRWEEMTTYANSTSGDAISELLFHCGVSVNMDYGANSSGAYTENVPDAFKNQFGYHPRVRFAERIEYSDLEWDILIRDNLDNAYPLLYKGVGSGGGHAFVCDGYQDTCFYHFNWGWSGGANGYFYYNDLSPYGSDFSWYQGAVYNIQPYFSHYCVSGKEMTEASREFEDGSGLSYYWPNTDCTWLIAPDSADMIRLNFISFDTELEKDKLFIYDGADDSANLIGSFSGNSLPAAITSTGNKLFLRFQSDDENQRQGWKISYVSLVIGIDDVEKQSPVKFFPNPTYNYLYLETKEEFNMQLIDLKGNTIITKLICKNSVIDVSGLKPGFYFLKFSNSRTCFSKKLLKYSAVQ